MTTVAKISRRRDDTTKSVVPSPSMTMSLTEAAELLGIHRTTAWSLHKRGEFPVPVLKLGCALRVVRSHLELYMSTGVPVESGTRFDAESSAS